jgi:hypothetical protein
MIRGGEAIRVTQYVQRRCETEQGKARAQTEGNLR